MDRYPSTFDNSPEGIIGFLKQIIRLRVDDVTEVNNFPNVYMSGRKVNKIPTSSSDVTAGKDKAGDFNYNVNYLFILVDNSGTLVWRRVALSSF